MAEVKVIYLLSIDLVTPAGYRERIELTDESAEGLEPRDSIYSVDFERYGPDDDFVDIRRDWIAQRRMEKIESNERERDDDLGTDLATPYEPGRRAEEDEGREP